MWERLAGHLDRVWPDVDPAPKSLSSRIQRVPARAGSGVQGESSRAIDRTSARRRYSPGSGPVGVYIWVASAVPSVRKASRALPTWMTSLGLSGCRDPAAVDQVPLAELRSVRTTWRPS
jgi:hypothetical protein